jgi:hypothetical protein
VAYLQRRRTETKLFAEKPCGIPVWAMARDARYVLAVEALSTKIVKDQEPHREVAKVRVVSSLKEPAPWLPGAIVSAHLLYWLNDASPPFEDEHLVPEDDTSCLPSEMTTGLNS